MKKIVLLLLLLIPIFIGCSKTPVEKMIKCIDDSCNQDDTSLIVIEYLDSITEDFEVNNYITNFSPTGALFQNKTTIEISIIYENSDLSYSNAYEQISKLYDLFVIMKNDLLNLDVDRNINVSTMVFIEEGINDYSVQFRYEESNDKDTIIIIMDGFKDEYSVFMDALYSNITDIVEYNDELDIRIDFTTDIGYIHLLLPKDQNEIELNLVSSLANDLQQSYVNGMISNLETELNNEFSVVVSED